MTATAAIKGISRFTVITSTTADYLNVRWIRRERSPTANDTSGIARTKIATVPLATIQGTSPCTVSSPIVPPAIRTRMLFRKVDTAVHTADIISPPYLNVRWIRRESNPTANDTSGIARTNTASVALEVIVETIVPIYERMFVKNSVTEAHIKLSTILIKLFISIRLRIRLIPSFIIVFIKRQQAAEAAYCYYSDFKKDPKGTPIHLQSIKYKLSLGVKVPTSIEDIVFIET